MKAGTPPQPLPEYRIMARRLLKELRSGSEEEALRAAARFDRLRSFSTKTIGQILEARSGVKLKHALAVIALEHGHESWRSLKVSLEAGGPEMYVPKMDVYLNRWFARYEQARASLEEQGGFLLPYGRQFFVCGEGAIRALGLNPDDDDRNRVSRDWVKPRDPEAWRRLREKREQAALNDDFSAMRASP